MPDDVWWADFESGDMVTVFDPLDDRLTPDGLPWPFEGWPTETARNIYLALKALFEPEPLKPGENPL